MSPSRTAAPPRIDEREFARRRRELMAHMEPDSIAILPSAALQMRNRDTAWPFRQDSDFQYLSGFAEPDAVLVLAPGRRHGEFLLFCRDRDPERERWDGPRADELIRLLARMDQEIRLLKASERMLREERAQLLRKNEDARSKVESMILRLRSLEQES